MSSQSRSKFYFSVNSSIVVDVQLFRLFPLESPSPLSPLTTMSKGRTDCSTCLAEEAGGPKSQVLTFLEATRGTREEAGPRQDPNLLMELPNPRTELLNPHTAHLNLHTAHLNPPTEPLQLTMQG